MSGENNAGAVIIGCFLLVCGAGLGLLGGCCSLLLVWDAISRTSGNFGETLPIGALEPEAAHCLARDVVRS